ncbi:RagB/SusD family nutrient uptake outer membrane protein [Zobellia uliginosa]|uniref:RagB/SusD family nutrient uptake outer membrane protein n=1 Tax=Zobellia uliginosa TaxID=143224 RepID=UPI001C07689F|nr:RagB/SusD family nutrient uptake outer membrane protein [Zobellia uliginosa]MBU2945738.1 RagB/SusD family nutrient uptake outer membrane protein [Zobellia uliginosa]
MKKILIYFYTLLSVALVISCSKFLDEEPEAVLGTNSFYKTESDAITAVSAVYDKLNKRSTTNLVLWRLADTSTPDTNGGFESFNHTPTNGDIGAFWSDVYEGISRANYAIENIPEIDMDPVLRERLVNEAKFLRGFYYFWLYQVYGEVPLVLEPISPSDTEALTQGKASTEDILTSIEQDFKDAEALPIEYDDGNVGRVTSGAAKAFLSRLYLFMEEWDKAAVKSNEVIDSKQYELLGDFREATWAKNTKESIFEMQAVPNTSGWEDLNEGSSITVWHRPGCIGGWGSHTGTQILYDAFEEGDPRREYTLLKPGDNYNDFTIPEDCIPDEQYGLLKLIGDPEFGEGADANASNNFIFMRLAEVYLMVAESEAELGNLTEAEDALEIVRARARNDARSIPEAIPELKGLSQPDLIAAVRNERRIELASEMKSFFDLVRWGIAGEVNRAAGHAFVDGKHEHFPIPQSQVDISEGNLMQNPGY